MRARGFLAAMATACTCAVAMAAGEHQQRLGAELLVMAGDARRLGDNSGKPLEREGLVARLSGGLSSLPLLLRRSGGDATAVAPMRAALGRRDWRALSARLTALGTRHPFDARPFLAGTPTPEMLALGASIHQTTCAGCHDAPAGDTLLPAFNLSQQIKAMPRDEFAARLLLGVRGDRMTSWRNPFSDPELAALIAWYANAR